ncbi:NUDIX domain-containing protein [Microbacterium sp. E-13]|uniref:NUDIX domain-containing protein n=1 Tax=Microbacterium sp. E-13 TaxID=3404048 RepID=UPI003CEB5F32
MHEIAVAVIVSRGQVLLAHRSPDREWYPDCWALIGGHIEAGESPEETITRECREELTIQIAKPCRVEFDFADSAVVLHTFLVDQWSGDPSNAAPHEHDALTWFDASSLLELRLAHPGLGVWLANLLAAASE